MELKGCEKQVAETNGKWIKALCREGIMVAKPDGLKDCCESIVAEAKDEADSKWVSVLKKYKMTVDSPESLAEAVDTVVAEAVKAERERIRKELSELHGTPEHALRLEVNNMWWRWQALKGESEK